MAQYWFKHIYNLSETEKVLELRVEHGWEGYGLFLALLERMAKLGEGTIDPVKSKLIATAIGGVDEDKLCRVIQTCIDVGLFIETESGFYQNEIIRDHLDEMDKYSKAGRKGAAIRWGDGSNKDANGPSNSPPTTEGNSFPNADKSRGDDIRTKAQNTQSKKRLKIEEGEDFSEVPLVDGRENGCV